MGFQVDALEAEGCARIIQETASGAKMNRPGLAEAVAACGSGDVLVVWKLDRLARTTVEVANLVRTLLTRDAGMKVLEGKGAAIDTTTATGRLTFHVLASVAEFERELILERTKAGMQAARKRGKHIGRPRSLSPDQLEIVDKLLGAGDRTQGQVAKALNVSLSTVKRAMKKRAPGATLEPTPLEAFLSKKA